MRKYLIFLIAFLIGFLSVNKVDAFYYKRLADASSNNSLASLNASGTDLEYKSGKYEYTVDFTLDSDQTKIYATTKSDKAVFVKGYGPRTVNLNFGKNEVLIKVQAENGDIATYTININRKDNRKKNNYLSNIVINGKALSFHKEKYVYSFSVDNTVDSLDVRVATENEKSAVVIIGAENLSYGNNKVYIDVKAENGDTRRYTLKVYRSKSKNIPLSSNTSLALLKVGGYKIKFDSTITEYKLVVKNEDDLDITAMAEDEKSTVKIVGRKKIKHNAVVEVRVIAEDGSQEVYKIKTLIEGMTIVNKAVIAILIIAIVAVVSLTILIITKKMQKKKQGSTMNFDVVRTDIPTIETNSEEDQQLMSFLLSGEGAAASQKSNGTNDMNQSSVASLNQSMGQANSTSVNVMNQNGINTQANADVNIQSQTMNNNSTAMNYSDQNTIPVNNQGLQTVCPHCGTINSVSSIVCVGCGNSLVNR